MSRILKYVILAVLACSSFNSSYAQENLSSDDLLKASQVAIRQEKNYPKAISLLKQALIKSPDYSDVRIMLGRVYTWSDFQDSARTQFQTVLQKDPNNQDALNASFDLEYWNNNPNRALEIANQALVIYPNSEELVIKKAKALTALKRPSEAINLMQDFAKTNPENKASLDLLESIKNSNLKNELSYGYSFSSFDKRFAEPWHMANVSYGRITPVGTLNFQMNYANRFSKNGVEFETNSYPSITKGLYAYVGAAFSNSSIFSRHRLGLSLYKSLPFSLEAEGGIRYLKFDESTVLYVVGFGRYFGSSFVGIRSYIGQGDGQFSKSFNLYSRFYLSDDRNDYFGISGGTGFSPDDRARIIDVNRNLKSLKAGLEYSRNLSRRLLVSASASFVNEEFRTETFGNQFTIGGSIQHRF